MNEEYLGSFEERRYIRSYLANIRRLDPIEIATTANPMGLDDSERLSRLIDLKLFWKWVEHSQKNLRLRFGIDIEPLTAKRYYVACPVNDEEPGGFHDPRSVGYHYWYRAGFVMLLNRHDYSRKLRTLELVRSYLHDSLHASTFVSFRLAHKGPATSAIQGKRRVPEVYREQYGINFRNQYGISYSSALLTEHSPEAINLNLLMDGASTIVVASILSECKTGIRARNEDERNILAEIFQCDTHQYVQKNEYCISVVHPARLFIDRWGGEPFIRLLLHAMVSGNLTKIKKHFETKTGILNAWEKKFQRENFQLPENNRCSSGGQRES